MATKLKAVKVGGLKKICHSATYTSHAGCLGLTPAQWDHSWRFTDHNFAALWPIETHTTSLERFWINSSQRINKILNIVFALLNCPHLHRAYYLVR